ncbi:hypothetical protein OESDEN_05111 [Oesophagostomum dentatum]|uniref:DNA topoisomerase n=1 Tax=Oesophagostomum dentatum TaxID=61180 RepID=A0A0B1TFQ1_OESDE|nr:hypothetical protein OESDEN_05111 [Oesophagostomum dentatum]
MKFFVFDGDLEEELEKENKKRTNGVCGCLQECGGVMVLDPQSHPKWRLSCNKCPSVVAMFEGALKFKVTEASCEDCDARIVAVEYKLEDLNKVINLLGINYNYVTSDNASKASKALWREV